MFKRKGEHTVGHYQKRKLVSLDYNRKITIMMLWERKKEKSKISLQHMSLEVKYLQKECDWVGCIVDYKVCKVGIFGLNRHFITRIYKKLIY